MVLYNANVELHTAAVMAIEISATGGVFATAQFRTQRLINYVHPADWVLFVVEMIFLLMLLFYIYEEVMEVRNDLLLFFLFIFLFFRLKMKVGVIFPKVGIM